MDREKLSLWLAIGSVVAWIASCACLWLGAVWAPGDRWVYDPIAVGGALGLVGLFTFLAIYYRETNVSAQLSHRLRSAIAGSVIIVFLLLVIDLLTIAGLRDSLAGVRTGSNAPSPGTTTGTVTPSSPATLSFVESIFDTYRWVVVTVIGFYFAAGAAESIGKNVEQSKKAQADAEKTRAQADVEVAKASVDLARANAAANP